jgi:hypothetical protein
MHVAERHVHGPTRTHPMPPVRSIQPAPSGPRTPSHAPLRRLKGSARMAGSSTQKLLEANCSFCSCCSARALAPQPPAAYASPFSSTCGTNLRWPLCWLLAGGLDQLLTMLVACDETRTRSESLPIALECPAGLMKLEPPRSARLASGCPGTSGWPRSPPHICRAALWPCRFVPGGGGGASANGCRSGFCRS